MSVDSTESRFTIDSTENLSPSRDTSTPRNDNFPFLFIIKRKYHIGMVFV